LSWKYGLVSPMCISPAGVICFQGSGGSSEMAHVDVSAERAPILMLSIPWFVFHVWSVVSSESSICSFEPHFLVQGEPTITMTIELDASVVVVQLEVSSKPSDDEVCGYSVSFHVRIVLLQQSRFLRVPLACVAIATWRVDRGMFPLAFVLFLFSVQLFRDAVFIRVKGVSAIEVVTDVVTDNWRFLELRLSILVSLIVLIVRDAGVLFLFGTWIVFTVAVAVADPSAVKTSSLTAVVV